MSSNLPNQQKTNWVANEIVMPTHTNEWGGAINKLTEAIPIYSVVGDYFKATYSSNIYNLTPMEFANNVSNVTVNQYIDGMSVIFKCPAQNSANCSVNVNSIGTKAIKTLDNLNLPAGKLKAGDFIQLKYDAVNNCFKFIEDITKQDKLYSGTNIKTIGGNSLLGSGNIGVKTIEGDSIFGTGNISIEDNVVDILKLIYPIGSIFVSTTEECPIKVFFGTWQKIGTSIITSVSSSASTSSRSASVSVRGDGKSLGLYGGSFSGYLATSTGVNTKYLGPFGSIQGTPGNSTVNDNPYPGAGGSVPVSTYFGITTDATKSGLTGSVTIPSLTANVISSNLSVNIFKRTA